MTYYTTINILSILSYDIMHSTDYILCYTMTLIYLYNRIGRFPPPPAPSLRRTKLLQSDCVRAYVQAPMTGTKTHIRLPKAWWPKHWAGRFRDPICQLLQALHGHPHAGWAAPHAHPLTFRLQPTPRETPVCIALCRASTYV